MKFTLPDLPYDYNALEPYIDEMTMKIHHDKHHQGYTDKLNAAIEGKSELADLTIEQLLQNNFDDQALKTAVINNGGGFYNHSLYWETMKPGGGGEPDGDLKTAIDDAFGSFSDFKEKFSTIAVKQFGSGWGWLVVDKDGKLNLKSTANQNSPITDKENIVLGVDVWEHAYYLKYQNKRSDYVEAWWNVVNWDQALENFKKAK